MESLLGLLIEGIVGHGEISALIVGVVTALILWKYLKPLKESIENLPNEEVRTAVQGQQEVMQVLLEKASLLEHNIKLLQDHVANIDQIEEFRDTSITRELERIRSETQGSRGIISQFYGHMLYSARSDSFGNREIK